MSTINRNDDLVKTITLTIEDSYDSKGDPNTLVPVTILPTDHDEMKLEWNPLGLIENIDDSVVPNSGNDKFFHADIDKHTMVGMDETETGIIVKIPKESISLLTIHIIGGYQVNILKGFNQGYFSIYLQQQHFDIENSRQYSSPKMNADFTSLVSGSIHSMEVFSAHLVLKTNAPVRRLDVKSQLKWRAKSAPLKLDAFPATVEILGDIGLNEGIRRDVLGRIELGGPNTTLAVDGNIYASNMRVDGADVLVTGTIKTRYNSLNLYVDGEFGKSTIRTGGFESQSSDNYSTFELSNQSNITVMTPNCAYVKFYSIWFWLDGNISAVCLEESGPQVSVEFLELEALESNKKNHSYPPYKIPWEIVAPMAICLILFIYVCYKYKRLCYSYICQMTKKQEGRDPSSAKQENGVERVELGTGDPQ